METAIDTVFSPNPPTLMARSIWKGAIAFGLVNIPVSLTSAESRPDIQLHMVDSKNHARIRYERVNADTGEEVPWDRMVKGCQHDDGKFILLSEEELDSVQTELTKTIEIEMFVSLWEIDTMLAGPETSNRSDSPFETLESQENEELGDAHFPANESMRCGRPLRASRHLIPLRRIQRRRLRVMEQNRIRSELV